MKKLSYSVIHSICTESGLCLAISIFAALSFLSVNTLKFDGKMLTADNGAKSRNSSDSAVSEIITVTEPVKIEFDDSEIIKEACKEYKEKVKKQEHKRQEDKKEEDKLQEDDKTVISDDTQSTTSATSAAGDDQTTVTTTLTSQITTTTTATREPEEQDGQFVSNGIQPFNYNDVSFIASDLNTLGDFVEKLSPSLISWDGSRYDESGRVKLSLESDLGSVVLDIKPLEAEFLETEQSGSVSGDELSKVSWFEQNSAAGCNISSVIWKNADFGITPIRNIRIGSSLAQLTDSFLCVNGGATTLYRASDVIKDQNKLNSILAAENLYTFVGGRVYSIGSYLDKYYNGREHSFRFEDCDYVVQYGCNSIMEHNYTTGSWIIEYAVKEDSVIGISFLNKSYYRTEPKTAISTNIPSSGSESGSLATTHAELSDIDESSGDEDLSSYDVLNEVGDTMCESDIAESNDCVVQSDKIA